MANATRTFATLPPAVTKLDTIFDGAREEFALVDGPMCGAFLGVTPHDFDMTTSTRPERIEELLAQWDSVTWNIGKEFGTIDERRDGPVVEVATYHIGEYEIGSRKSEVTFGDTLEGDLTRHGLTVNTMAMRLPQMALVDPCGGFADLAGGDLRTPVPAEQSFDDDPLHIMRAARLSAQLSLDVDMDVMNTIETMASRLEIVSAEHIHAEFERLIISPYPRRGIELMMRTGVADIVLPEAAGLVSTVNEHKRHKDIYERALTVVEQTMDPETGPDGTVPAPDFILRFATPMHDVGKPATHRFESNGTVSFHHHEIIDTGMTRKCMKALHFNEATIEAVSNLVVLHLRFHGYGGTTWSNSAVRRYVTDTGGLLKHLHRLTCADCTARNRRKASYLPTTYGNLETRIIALREQEEPDAIRPDLDNNQIMEILGLHLSRAMKIARDYLLKLRMEHGLLGEEATRQALLDWWASGNVRALAKEYQAQQAHWEAKVAEKKARKAAAKAAREAQGQ